MLFRSLLATAPKNPISVGNLNKAITSAQSLSSEDKARASSALLAAAQKEMSDKLGAGTLADADAGARGPAGKNGSKANQDEELLQLGVAPPVAADTNKLDDLSPEIKEALLAKQAADVKSSAATMNLFQRVHIKYLDKTKMILGYDPKSGWKGVGNENGF